MLLAARCWRSTSALPAASRGRRSTAVPAFSGPRSRATTAARHPHRVNTVYGPPAPGRPRMGPAPAGTTAALPASAVACRHEVLGACRGRWFGYAIAGPIRGRPGGSRPQALLTRRALRTSLVARERGPESAYPDRLPARRMKRSLVKVAQGPQAACRRPRFHASRGVRSAVEQLSCVSIAGQFGGLAAGRTPSIPAGVRARERVPCQSTRSCVP